MGELSDLITGQPQTADAPTPDNNLLVLPETPPLGATPAAPAAPKPARTPSPISDRITGAADPAAKLSTAVEQGRKMPADRAAKILQLEMSTGLPADLIARNLDAVETAAQKKGFDAKQFMATSPLVANWLSKNPTYASVAQHDLARLSLTEALLKAGKAKFDANTYAADNFFNDVKQGWLGLQQTLAAIPYTQLIKRGAEAAQTGDVQIATDPFGQPIYASQMAGSEKHQQELVTAAKKAGNAATLEFVRSVLPIQQEIAAIPQRPATLAALNATSWADTYKAFKQDPLGVMEDIGVTSTVQQLPALALTAATRSPIVTAFAMGSNSYAMEIGQGILGYLGNKGVDINDPKVVLKALQDPATAQQAIDYGQKRAAVVGAFDFLSGGVASKLAVPEKLIGNEVGRELTNIFVAQPLSQGALGAMGEAGGQLAAQGRITQPGQVFAEFAGEFTHAPLESATFGYGRLKEHYNAIQEAARAKQAVDTTETLDALDKVAKATKMREHAPTQYEQLVKDLAANGRTDTVYVPVEHWDSYYQSQKTDPEAAAKEITGDPQAYTEAQVTGDLAIPLERYASKIAGTDTHAALAEDLRFSPEDMTLREAKDYQANGPALIDNLLKETKPTEKGPTNDTSSKVYESALGKLVGAGMDKTAAESQAQLVAQSFKALGERSGIDPLTLYNRYALSVERKLPGGGRVSADQTPSDLKGKVGAFFQRIFNTGKDVPLDERGVPAVAQGSQETFTVDGKPETANPDTPRGIAIRALAQPDKTSLDELLAPFEAVGEHDFVKQAREEAKALQGRVGYTQEFYQGSAPEEFKPAGEEVSGLKVLSEIPNQDSISASLTDYQILDGVREVPFTAFTQMGELSYYSKSEKERTQKLAEEIKASGEIKPLIVAVDSEGPYVLEGGHRFDALRELGVKSFPAMVVLEDTTLNQGAAATDQTQTEAFKKWFGDSKVVDANGEPLVVYHGTTADFTSFSAEKGNPESDFGAGFHFTNTPEDVANNYAGFGPDLTQKIELLAERYESNDELSREEALAKAREQYASHEGMTMPVYLKMENPAVVGAPVTAGTPDETHLDYEWVPHDEVYIDEARADIKKEYADEIAAGDYSKQEVEDLAKERAAEMARDNGDESEEGTLVDFIEGLRDAASSYYDANVDTAIANLVEKGADGGLSLAEAIDIIKNTEDFNYATDENGALASNEIIRDALERAGFDGIIDNTVDEKFGSQRRIGKRMQGMQPDTVHYVAFNPEQIKSAVGNRGTFDPNNPSILEQSVFQGGTEDNRGSIQFNPERSQFNVTLAENADLSTFLHETGHYYLEVMRDLVKRGEASAQLQSDWGTILDFVGAKPGEELTRDQHETFARAFEAYLGEGKAPSPTLQTAFEHFKQWILSVYRSLKNLNVGLTDEVRGVFDRLLATDEEIQAAEAMQNYQGTFASAEAAGMDPKQFAAYQDLLGEANAQAQAELAKEAMSEALRAKKAWYRERRAKVRAEVAAELDAQPVYQAMSFLQKGTLPDGTLPEGVVPVKLSRQAIVDDYGDDMLKRLPRPYVYTRDGGVAPDAIAPMFGYANGDELIFALADAKPRSQAIEETTTQRLDAEYGDLLTDGTLPQKAMDAVHNDKRLAVMLAEQRALDRLTGRKRSPTTRQVVKAAARHLVRQKALKDIKPNTYRVAEAKAARQAFEAAGKQDYNAASLAKSRELLNHELYREARAALDQAEKTRKFMASFSKTSRRTRLGKAGADYLAQMDALLHAYEFRRVPLKELARRESLAEFLARHESDVQPIERPKYAEDDAAALNAHADAQSKTLPELRAEVETTNWMQLTPDELQGVRDNAELIWHLAKLKDSLLASRRYKNLLDAVQTVSASIREKANRTLKQTIQSDMQLEKVKRNTAEYLAMSRRIPTFVAEMDGGEAGGALWEAYVRPLNEATNDFTDRMQKHQAAFAEIYNRHYSKQEQKRMFSRPQTFDAIDARLTKDAVLAAALNWGNETNRSRLMDGEKWSVQQVQSLLSTLDKRDWLFVQDVWNYVNTYWPDFSENHRALFGIPPEKVEGDIDPVLRAAMDKHGIELTGGYYPIKFDTNRSVITAERAIKQEGKRYDNPRNRTRAGAAISRVQGKVAIPLRLSVASVVNGHISDVIHHIAFDKTLLDVSRILHHPDVRDAILEHYGKPVFDRFNRMLVDVKWGTKPAENGFENFLNGARNGASVAGMALSVTTTVLQPLGLTNSISLVGASWIAKGIARVGKDAVSLQNAAAYATSQSTFMRYRRLGPNREIGDVLNRLRKRGWRSKLDAIAFWTITNMQFAAVDLPTWYGALEKAKAAGFDHDTSVQIADQMVRDAQGGGDLIDQTEFQRGGPYTKLFTNFISYVATTYSLHAQQYRTTKFTDPVQIAHFAMDTLLLMIAPAVGSVALDAARLALTGGGDELRRRSGKDWAERVAMETANMYAGPFIGARDLMDAVRGYDYAGPAGLTVFGAASSFIQQLKQGKLDEAFWRSLNTLAGVLLHLPAVQIDRTVRGAYALGHGDSHDPWVLLLGPPPKKRGNH